VLSKTASSNVVGLACFVCFVAATVCAIAQEEPADKPESSEVKTEHPEAKAEHAEARTEHSEAKTEHSESKEHPAIKTGTRAPEIEPPELRTNVFKVERTFMVAEEVCRGNIRTQKRGLLSAPAPILMAGVSYPAPVTRDGSINAWNGIDFIAPGVGKNTLLALLEDRDGKTFIGGEVFDDVIWVPAAWNEYLYSGDKEFLKTAFLASKETLSFLESKMFDEHLGLFKGAGLSCDVSGHPDKFLGEHEAAGEMHALSTNCAYYAAYKTLELMAKELGAEADPNWSTKSEALKTSINKQFWDEKRGTYKFIVDSENGDDSQESPGLALAIIYGIPDEEQTKSIFSHIQLTKYGIACLWPPFPRFAKVGGFGNHSGLLWPFMQALWADACLRTKHFDLFDLEFNKLTEMSLREGWFCQSYEPVAGMPSGGIAGTRNRQQINTYARPYQSWSATAYIRMVVLGIFGMKFAQNGITFQPHLPSSITDLKLSNFHYRSGIFDIHLTGKGNTVSSFNIDDKPVSDNLLSCDLNGKHSIEIVLSE